MGAAMATSLGSRGRRNPWGEKDADNNLKYFAGLPGQAFRRLRPCVPDAHVDGRHGQTHLGEWK